VSQFGTLPDIDKKCFFVNAFPDTVNDKTFFK